VDDAAPSSFVVDDDDEYDDDDDCDDDDCDDTDEWMTESVVVMLYRIVTLKSRSGLTSTLGSPTICPFMVEAEV
jgi:hypothetical protein